MSAWSRAEDVRCSGRGGRGDATGPVLLIFLRVTEAPGCQDEQQNQRIYARRLPDDGIIDGEVTDVRVNDCTGSSRPPEYVFPDSPDATYKSVRGENRLLGALKNPTSLLSTVTVYPPQTAR